VTERIGDLSLPVAPELVRERVQGPAPASSARCQRASTSSLMRWRTTAVPPIVSGESTSGSGNSSASITVESPKCSSMLRSLPSGRGTRLRSSAPSARTYHRAASDAPRTTMCGVIACTAKRGPWLEARRGPPSSCRARAPSLQDPLGPRELDLVVLDDLDVVAPWVEEVEPAARADLHAGGLESAPRRLLVVDHETEMAGAVRTARAALHERKELITDVDEDSAVRATSQRELEEPSVERERLLDVADLECHVVDTTA